MGKGKLIIFSAPSGSGKTTIVKQILKTDIPFQFSVSATSRPPRDNEIDGRDYYFLTPKTFREKIENHEFLEWEEVYEDQYYGTLKSEVERIRENNHHVLFDIDVVGGLNIKKQFGNEALSIFVMPPHIKELEKRLKIRGTENEESLSKRLAKSEHEMTFAPEFDKVIINDELQKAVEETHKIIKEFLNHE